LISLNVLGETYYLTQFTVGEYFAANIKSDDPQDAMLGMVSLSLANEDGSRRFPDIAEGRTFVSSLPLGAGVALLNAVTEMQGMSEKKD
jgi:hypothetical protein